MLLLCVASFATLHAEITSAQSSDEDVALVQHNIETVLASGYYFSGEAQDKKDQVYRNMQDAANSAHMSIDMNIKWPKIIKVETTSRCVVHVWVGPMTMDVTGRDYYRPANLLLNSGDFDLPWNRLISARADSGKVLLMWKGASRESVITTQYGSKGVVDSINFMRTECAGN